MIINGETTFVSDTHFGHTNILKHSPTRLLNLKTQTIETHNKWLESNWNKKAKKDTLLIHLGDFAMKDKTILNKLHLNGNIKLLKGNHDDLHNSDYISKGFELIDNSILINEFKNDIKFLKLIKEYKLSTKYFNFILFDYDSIRFLASHFPIVDTMGYDVKYSKQIEGLMKIFEYCKCNYNLHGHTHYNQMDDDRCLNISVENTNFSPITLDEIISKFNLKG